MIEKEKTFWDAVYDSPAKMIAFSVITAIILIAILGWGILLFNPDMAKKVREHIISTKCLKIYYTKN